MKIMILPSNDYQQNQLSAWFCSSVETLRLKETWLKMKSLAFSIHADVEMTLRFQPTYTLKKSTCSIFQPLLQWTWQWCFSKSFKLYNLTISRIAESVSTFLHFCLSGFGASSTSWFLSNWELAGILTGTSLSEQIFNASKQRRSTDFKATFNGFVWKLEMMYGRLHFNPCSVKWSRALHCLANLDIPWSMWQDGNACILSGFIKRGRFYITPIVTIITMSFL